MSALPVGYVLITRDKYFNPNTTSNNLFVGIWEKIDEYDIYPVATSEGASQISLVGGISTIGNNSQSIRIDWQHTHTQNSHGHSASSGNDSHTHTLGDSGSILSTEGSTRNWAGTGTNFGGISRTTSSDTHSHTVTVSSSTATNQNAGTITNATQIIDNRPYSFKTTMWIRIT